MPRGGGGSVRFVNRFDNTSVLLTGGGSGIGRASALRLVAEGAVVFAVDVDGAGLAATARAADGQRLHQQSRQLGYRDPVLAVLRLVEQFLPARVDAFRACRDHRFDQAVLRAEVVLDGGVVPLTGLGTEQ